MPRRSSSKAQMVIGTGVITFRLHDCRSLKAKRSVVKSIIHKIRNNFNASVAEVGANDAYGRALIGFTMAGSDHSVMNAKIDKLLNMVDDLGLAEMLDTEIEIVHM